MKRQGDPLKLLRHYGVPTELVILIKNSYQGKTGKLMHGGQFTNSFRVKTGVRQGCLLSPFPLLREIGWIIKTSTSQKMNRIQWTSETQLGDLDFADELALLPHSHQQMQDKTTELATTLSKVSPKIHKGKTKILWINEVTTDQATLDRSALEEMEVFAYLGNNGGIGGIDVDVKARTGQARATFLPIRNTWS